MQHKNIKQSYLECFTYYFLNSQQAHSQWSKKRPGEVRSVHHVRQTVSAAYKSAVAVLL
jgi:hypothetical protein